MNIKQLIQEKKNKKEPHMALLQEMLDKMFDEKLSALTEEFSLVAEEKKKEILQDVEKVKNEIKIEAKEIVNPLVKNFHKSKQEIEQTFSRISKVQRGGDGYTPKKGKDYFDGKNGETPTEEKLLSLIVPLIPKEISKTSITDTPNEIVDKINTAQKKIDIISIDGLMEIIKQLKEVVRYRGGGGGDVVEAGSGITITRSSGRKIISVSGGGTGVTVETPVGTVNSINTVFTVTAEPKWVVSGAATYFDGAGYTYSALSITMDIPPNQGEAFRAII